MCKLRQPAASNQAQPYAHPEPDTLLFMLALESGAIVLGSHTTHLHLCGVLNLEAGPGPWSVSHASPRPDRCLSTPRKRLAHIHIHIHTFILPRMPIMPTLNRSSQLDGAIHSFNQSIKSSNQIARSEADAALHTVDS
jgi:hypothetical protein